MILVVQLFSPDRRNDSKKRITFDVQMKQKASREILDITLNFDKSPRRPARSDQMYDEIVMVENQSYNSSKDRN